MSATRRETRVLNSIGQESQKTIDYERKEKCLSAALRSLSALFLYRQFFPLAPVFELAVAELGVVAEVAGDEFCQPPNT